MSPALVVNNVVCLTSRPFIRCLSCCSTTFCHLLANYLFCHLSYLPTTFFVTHLVNHFFFCLQSQSSLFLPRILLVSHFSVTHLNQRTTFRPSSPSSGTFAVLGGKKIIIHEVISYSISSPCSHRLGYFNFLLYVQLPKDDNVMQFLEVNFVVLWTA